MNGYADEARSVASIPVWPIRRDQRAARRSRQIVGNPRRDAVAHVEIGVTPQVLILGEVEIVGLRILRVRPRIGGQRRQSAREPPLKLQLQRAIADVPSLVISDPPAIDGTNGSDEKYCRCSSRRPAPPT